MLSIERNAAARHDAVDVRVVRERRAPGMKHRRQADPGAEVLRVGGDGEERLGRDLEQDVVDHGLVVIGDVADRRRQGEHHVVIRQGQQLSRAIGKPFLRCRSLALGTVPVAAGARRQASPWSPKITAPDRPSSAREDGTAAASRR